MGNNVKLLCIYCAKLNADTIREGTELSFGANLRKLFGECDPQHLVCLYNLQLLRVKLGKMVVYDNLQEWVFLIDKTHSDLLSNDGVGIGERGNETGVEGVVSNGSLGALGTSNLGSLVLEGGLAGGVTGLGGNDLVGAGSLGEGVELEGGLAGGVTGIGGNDLVGAGSLGEGVELLHHVAVLERVLLCLVVETDGGLDSAELGLNLVRVDDSGKVGTVDGVTLELVSTFLGSLNGVGAENVVEAGEGIGGEHDESSDVTTGGELEKVESVDVA